MRIFWAHRKHSFSLSASSVSKILSMTFSSSMGEMHWIEWSCVIFFWWKIKLGLSVLVFLFFVFSLSRGWTGTCFIKDTSSAIILGGIVFVKTTSSSCVLVFLVLFCLFVCSSSFSIFILFLNFFCLQLRYTFLCFR